MSMQNPPRSEPANERKPNPIQAQRFLGGVDYPASRAEIIEQARKHQADEQTLDMLEHLPDQQYESPAAVSKQIGQQH
ncbi:DUF2795 domain-containing protein [Amantichitinum ursilacus]|uniref:DUF2795 domain-containing protein n=1 Tax=Amantichitinum ursilacus TaxID=857265 RepID=A0A0N0GL05_9NEIS|nr:DUF2795 domain-containing protein [Amantichitinum ursilacus]KPC49335.1 hypothetical protein WG78_20610 [Amantichitinum ursilacus]